MRSRLVLGLVIAALAAGGAEAQEKSPFRVYLDDRTAENFVAAYESYEQMRSDTVNNGATIVLAYLALYEMQKNLGLLEENAADLSTRHKFQYANILLALERYDESIELYTQINEASPKWSCGWRHRGEAYWKRGDLEQAVECLEKAIETRETHYDAYVYLAKVLRDMERYPEALETLEKGLTYYGKDIEDPEEEVASVDVAFLHLDLLEKCGLTEKHRELYEKVKKKYPDDERLTK